MPLPNMYEEWDSEDSEWRRSALLMVGGNPKMATWPLEIVLHQLSPGVRTELIRIVRQRMMDSVVLEGQATESSIPVPKIGNAADLDKREMLWRRQNEGEYSGGD